MVTYTIDCYHGQTQSGFVLIFLIYIYFSTAKQCNEVEVNAGMRELTVQIICQYNCYARKKENRHIDDEGCNKLQDYLSEMHEWCKKLDMKSNKIVCHTMKIGKKKNRPYDVHNMGQTTINQVNEVT